MFRLLKKLFGDSKPPGPEPADDPLALLGRDRGRTEKFLSYLAQTNVWILALGKDCALPSEDLSTEKLLSHIERNAQELNALSDGDGIVPFLLERGASPVLPFFSSMEFAEHFIRTERWSSVVAFQALALRSGFITQPELADCHLVLNLNSQSERPLTEKERGILRELVAGR